MTSYQKEKKNSQVSGSGVYSSVITKSSVITDGSVISKSLFSNVILKSERLGSLVNRHLLVHHFKIQVLQVISSGMLGEVTPQKLKAFEVPTEEYSVVLVSLLESLNEPGSNGLKLLFGCQKLLVLLQC